MISVYDTILTLNPHSSNVMGRKGLNLYDLGRLEEAISYFDKVLGADSDNSAVLLHFYSHLQSNYNKDRAYRNKGASRLD